MLRRLVDVAIFVLLGSLSGRAAPAAETTPRPALEGAWEGTLNGALRVVLRIDRRPDGMLHGVLDSPDQGALGIEMDSVWVAGDTAHCEWRRLKASYVAVWSSDGRELVGNWTQGAYTLPLTMKRLDQAPQYRRPQEPTPPYPYDAEEVGFPNPDSGFRLAGTLTLPRARGPHACVLLISGFGLEDRDETVFGHRSFFVLVDDLTCCGIVVLRVDDRGVGGSTGDPVGATSQDLAGDARAAIAFLKTRKDIDARRLGLIGHSEGGLIAPLVAVAERGVAFIVLMAGPGVPGDSILYAQGELILRAQGASETTIAAQRRLQREVFATVREEPDTAKAAARIRAAFLEFASQLPESARAGLGSSAIAAQIRQVRYPWFRYFIDYDPCPTLRRVKCPVLAINGERDVQVPARENLDAIGQALREGRNRDVTLRALPGLNHLFQTCRTGAVSEYVTIEETISPAALAIVGDWVVARTKR